MTFNIEAVDGNNYPDGIPRCEIEINGYLENCPLITNLWCLENYRNQWKIALTYLYQKKVKKCMLITDISKKKISAAITFWALYLEENDDIVIREIFIRDPDRKILLNPIIAENLINCRNEDEDEDDGEEREKYEISEWKIKFEDISHLVESI